MKIRNPYLVSCGGFLLAMGVIACATMNRPFSSNFGTSVPVIMYHRVVPDDQKVSAVNRQNEVTLYTRSVSEFKKEMAYLADHGFTPISFYQLTDYLASKDAKQLPRKPVIISFDDGSADWFDLVLPILASDKFKATFFLITDDESRRQYLGEDFAPVTWPQVQRIANYRSETGERLFDIESHSYTHMDLSATLLDGSKNGLPNGQQLADKVAIVREEMARSMRTIQERTGRRPAFLALPYGAGAWESVPDSLTFPLIKSIAREIGYLGIRTSRNDIPNNFMTDPYMIGAQLTMLSITTYEQFVDRLKPFGLD